MKEQQKNNMFNFIKKYYWQLLISTALILGLFVAPLLTQARFKAFLNGFTAVIAREYYFTSNYLGAIDDKDDDGVMYIINGWDGQEIQDMAEVQIRNFNNALLTNTEGQDLNYTMEWKVTTHDAEGKDVTGIYPYSLNFTYNEQPVRDNTSLGGGTARPEPEEPNIQYNLTYDEEKGYAAKMPEQTEELKCSTTGEIEGKILGGESLYNAFSIDVVEPVLLEDDEEIKDNYSVKVTLTATNSGNQYYGKLKATFVYNVSLDDNFVRDNTIIDTSTEEAYEKDIIFKLKTSVVKPGDNIKKIIHLWWDEEKLKVNWHNYYFNVLKDQNLYFKNQRVQVGTVGEGEEATPIYRSFAELSIPAESLAALEFEFTKIGSYVFEQELDSEGNLTEDGITYFAKNKYYNYNSDLLTVKPDAEDSVQQITADDYIGFYIEEIITDIIEENQ